MTIQSSVITLLELRRDTSVVVGRAGSLELDLIESVLFNPVGNSFLSEHLFHATLSNSLGVEYIEKLSVLVYLI